MYRNFLIAILVFGLLGVMIGCSKTTDSSPDDGSIAEEFDGFLPTNESAAFGDPSVAALGEDTVYNDLLTEDPSVDSIINNNHTGVYAVRIIWGSPEFDSTISEITDWTGSLSVNHGAVVLRRLIRFEFPQDYIKPRYDRKLVEWVSKTTVHNDGIFVNVYNPPSATDDIKTITFTTGPFTRTFEIGDLEKMDTVFYLDDSVNAVAIHALKIYPHGCPKGFLEGRWGKDSTGQGIFYGRWMSQHGWLMGHLRGRWGKEVVNSTDTTILRVFYGKYIDVTGQFKGLLRGIYISHPTVSVNAECPPHGRFFGYFYDANRNILGVLKGHYLMVPSIDNRKMGYFGGRWKAFCPRSQHENDGIDEINVDG